MVGLRIELLPLLLLPSENFVFLSLFDLVRTERFPRHDARFDDVQSKKKDTGAMSDYLFRDTFKASGFKLVAKAC